MDNLHTADQENLLHILGRIEEITGKQEASEEEKEELEALLLKIELLQEIPPELSGILEDIVTGVASWQAKTENNDHGSKSLK
jgi:type III secretion system FlhB-like substrate exporter